MKIYKRRHTETRSCEWCGRIFEAPSKRSRFCSAQCRLKARNKSEHPDWYQNRSSERTCPTCGKLFYAENKRRLFCSRKCKDKSYEHLERNKIRDRERYEKSHPGCKTREDIINRARIERAKQENEKSERYAVTHYCEICGAPYHTYNPRQKTCSTECGKQLRSRKKDRRLNKDNTIDRNITLRSLYEKDQGICYICGFPCDFGDYEIIDGKKVYGNLYPSIDHVIPIARGGLHEWSNVRLAHRICNSVKSDNVNDRTLREYLNHADLVEPPQKINPRKPVKQTTRDGLTVAIYESTVDAERKTGIKQKGIQKNARGECKSYGGFIWNYV